MFVAGDIGGTKSNLAFFELHAPGMKPIFERTLPSRDYTKFEDLINDFLGSTDIKARRAFLSIAGPVQKGVCVTTNLPWTVDRDHLETKTGLVQVELVNDLLANANGISMLAETDFVTLNAGEPSPGTAAVISAGTGLGQAGLYWDGQRHHAFPSEGGHSSFSPNSPIQSELLEFMRERLGREYNTKVAHVSVERVLSGMGLHNIYDFLKHKGELKEPDWLAEELKNSDDIPAAISRAAFEKNVEICVEALNMLATIYGSEAGNLALKLLATAGVFIGGGIAPKILPKLKEPHFMNAFVEKGRMKPLLQKIPIKVITNSKTALIGAAKAGREQFSRLEASIR